MAERSLDELFGMGAAQDEDPRHKPLFEQPKFAPPQQPQFNGWDDKLMAFMNGTTHGFTSGAMNSAHSVADPEGYARQKARNEQHPFSNAAGQMLGGGLQSVVTYPYKVAESLGWAGRTGLAALQGGIQGGLQGGNEQFANGGSASDVLTGAATHGLGGAIGGAAGHGIGEAAGDAARMFANYKTPAVGGPNTGPNRYANDTIDKTMRAQGVGPGRIERDMAHLGPQSMLADHPAMSPAIKQLNRAGGEGHEQFVEHATERVAGMPVRRGQDFAQPQNSFLLNLNRDIEAAGTDLDNVVRNFPPNLTLDGFAVRNDLVNIARDATSYGDGTMATKVLGLAEALPERLDPKMLHNTKKELDSILGWDNTKGPKPGPLKDTRMVLDRHLDNASADYNAANQAFRNLELQREAHALGLQKNLEPADADALNKAAAQLNMIPTSRMDVVGANMAGAKERITTGPMERETVFDRTMRQARRDPGAEKEAIDVGTTMALAAPHGIGAFAAAGASAGANKAVHSFLKPGEEEGKALARFLRLSPEERAQALYAIADRGAVVKDKGKLYAERLRNVTRGVGASGGELVSGAADPVFGLK